MRQGPHGRQDNEGARAGGSQRGEKAPTRKPDERTSAEGDQEGGSAESRAWTSLSRRREAPRIPFGEAQTGTQSKARVAQRHAQSRRGRSERDGRRGGKGRWRYLWNVDAALSKLAKLRFKLTVLHALREVPDK